MRILLKRFEIHLWNFRDLGGLANIERINHRIQRAANGINERIEGRENGVEGGDKRIINNASNSRAHVGKELHHTSA